MSTEHQPSQRTGRCPACGHPARDHCGCGAHCFARVAGPPELLIVYPGTRFEFTQLSFPTCRCSGFTDA